jgi:hypothetical protein
MHIICQLSQQTAADLPAWWSAAPAPRCGEQNRSGSTCKMVYVEHSSRRRRYNIRLKTPRGNLKTPRGNGRTPRRRRPAAFVIRPLRRGASHEDQRGGHVAGPAAPPQGTSGSRRATCGIEGRGARDSSVARMGSVIRSRSTEAALVGGLHNFRLVGGS